MMKKAHFNDAELRSMLLGAEDRAEDLRTLAAHLLHGCKECRQTLTRSEAWTGPDAKETPAAYGDGLQRALARVSSKDLRRVTSAETAREHLTELLDLPVEEAQRRIRSRPESYRDPRLAHLLLERAQQVSLMAPPEAREVALIAQSVITEIASDRSLSKRVLADLEARSEAHMGNACRLLGHYEQARRHFERAYGKMEQGTGDPLCQAELLHLESSLLRDQRHFEDAISSVRQAISSYRYLGDDHQVGRCQVSLALVYREAGDCSEAARLLTASLDKLDFEIEPNLEAVVQTTRALCTAEAGNPEQGLEILKAYPVEEFPTRRLRLHGLWTQGLILSEQERYAEAAETLGVVYTGFAELGEAHNTALAALDLALAFAHQGDAVPVQHLAHDALRLLEPLNVPRDTYASLLLFQRAAHTQRATVRWIQELKNNLSDPRRWRSSNA